MRQLLIVALLAIGTSSAARAQEHHAPRLPAMQRARAAQPTEAQRAVEQVVRNIFEISSRGELDGLERLYHPDATIVDFSGFTKGWENYVNKMRPYMGGMVRAMSNKPGAHEIGDIVVSVAGDVAWTTYSYNYVMEANNKSSEFWGMGTMVLRHVDGRWQVVHAQAAGQPRESWERQASM